MVWILARDFPAFNPERPQTFSKVLNPHGLWLPASSSGLSSGSVSRTIVTARRLRTAAISAAIALAADPARVADAGQNARTDSLLAIDGPPPPAAPEVIARDASGRATIRAIRLTEPIRLDGQLDEAIYTTFVPMSGFIQVEPQGGALATEQTEAWVMFDADQVFVGIRCRDSHPERMVANEMRRDNNNIYSNEYIGVHLDTFHDQRNAYYFSTTPLGGRGDGQITNEKQYNGDLNPIWDVHVGRFDGGWTAEFAIPFKSLRYRPGRAQIWGFNIERLTKWKNELSFLTRMPMAMGNRAFLQVSAAATLVGIEAPRPRNLEIKPYVTSNLTTDVAATPRVSNDVGAAAGLDVKYGVTQNLTADFSYNTDFAQVEADEQQVNLTRFSLFFPEKRDFFLENQGTFAFGGAGTQFGGTGTSDTPILFYSRRIGLNQVTADGRVAIVPIDAGGRLTGRVGRFEVGLLNIQVGDEPLSGSRPTNFSVVRLKRDILRRSSIGLLYAGRSVNPGGSGRNDAYGVDGAFAFFDNLSINTYWARSRTPDLEGDDTSYRLQVDYAGDRYGVQLERLLVGDHFNPEVGFVRRDDILRHFGLFRFSPRPKSSTRVRKFISTASIARIENGNGRLETRSIDGEFAVQFQNSDQLTLHYTRAYEFLAQTFRIAPGVVLPIAGYEFDFVRGQFNFGRQRLVSGNVSVESGAFYDGHRTAVGVGSGRLSISPRLSIEPSVSINWVDLVEGTFTTRLVGSRITYTMTPRVFASALVQYNSSNETLAANVRLRWEYRPGSELFIVYNEQRDTLTPWFPAISNRALLLKINRLFRY